MEDREAQAGNFKTEVSDSNDSDGPPASRTECYENDAEQ